MDSSTMQSSVPYNPQAPLHPCSPILNTSLDIAVPTNFKTRNTPFFFKPIITDSEFEENKENIPPSVLFSTPINTLELRLYCTIIHPITWPRISQGSTSPNIKSARIRHSKLEPNTHRRRRPTSNLQALHELSLEEIQTRSTLLTAPPLPETNIELESTTLPDFEGAGEGSLKPVRSARSAARPRLPKKQKTQKQSQKEANDSTQQKHDVNILGELPFTIYKDVDA